MAIDGGVLIATKQRVYIRKRSFFEQSKLTLQKWLLLMHWWARQYPVTDAAVEVEVTEKNSNSSVSVAQRRLQLSTLFC